MIAVLHKVDGVYELVAVVRTTDKRTAFCFTQNTDKTSWCEALLENVLPRVRKPRRSTSVGDVLWDLEMNHHWEIVPVGFRACDPVKTLFQS